MQKKHLAKSNILYKTTQETSNWREFLQQHKRLLLQKKKKNPQLISYLMMKELKVFPYDQKQGKMLALITLFIFASDCCWVFVAAWDFL